ncbi:hypothetical protein V474_22820 [Novosphingobium barchaimii LL02]|uniref:Uncharacterized protein n=1 Tax=Novosphingobium barchaimii LL02 TaxID=1114963 RepID=A0A0J7XNU6_9SPHN|nr:hypothetical protein [Novosphingobium barchaimii]KMS53616.1 hypothetical protein V474_22820 [Novosphingobium barchaimii LL02]
MNAIKHSDFTTLADFRINGTLPFCDSPDDLARSSLDEAHALTLVISNLLGETGPDEITVSPRHLGRALEGIRTLISLGAWASECERKGR